MTVRALTGTTGPKTVADARPGRRNRYLVLPSVKTRVLAPTADSTPLPVPKPGPYTHGPHPKVAA